MRFSILTLFVLVCFSSCGFDPQEFLNECENQTIDCTEEEKSDAREEIREGRVIIEENPETDGDISQVDEAAAYCLQDPDDYDCYPPNYMADEPEENLIPVDQQVEEIVEYEEEEVIPFEYHYLVRYQDLETFRPEGCVVPSVDMVRYLIDNGYISDEIGPSPELVWTTDEYSDNAHYAIDLVDGSIHDYLDITYLDALYICDEGHNE